MALLDIVSDKDEIIGNADFLEIHEKGLRHRSVQIFVFQYPDWRDESKLLVAERSSKQETSPHKLHPSAGGHVRLGQSYAAAAIEETREELFHDKKELPRGFVFHELALFPGDETYRNDTRETNRENTRLFITNYSGPFFPNQKEIEKVFWADPNEIFEDMKNNPENYTRTFINAMDRYMTILRAS